MEAQINETAKSFLEMAIGLLSDAKINGSYSHQKVQVKFEDGIYNINGAEYPDFDTAKKVCELLLRIQSCYKSRINPKHSEKELDNLNYSQFDLNSIRIITR